MYDEGPPPPDFPVGGESSVHRCALERPAVTQVEPPGKGVRRRSSGTRGEGEAGRQGAAALGVAAGPGMGAGVGLVVGVAASGRGGVGEGAGGGEAEAIPHYQCMLHY